MTDMHIERRNTRMMWDEYERRGEVKYTKEGEMENMKGGELK